MLNERDLKAAGLFKSLKKIDIKPQNVFKIS